MQLLDGREYEVEDILDSKIVRNKFHYLLDWSSYSPNDQTWEPTENLNNAKKLSQIFTTDILKTKP
mgnify:CR=1 FL=1